MDSFNSGSLCWASKMKSKWQSLWLQCLLLWWPAQELAVSVGCISCTWPGFWRKEVGTPWAHRRACGFPVLPPVPRRRKKLPPRTQWRASQVSWRHLRVLQEVEEPLIPTAPLPPLFHPRNPKARLCKWQCLGWNSPSSAWPFYWMLPLWTELSSSAASLPLRGGKPVEVSHQTWKRWKINSFKSGISADQGSSANLVTKLCDFALQASAPSSMKWGGWRDSLPIPSVFVHRRIDCSGKLGPTQENNNR